MKHRPYEECKKCKYTDKEICEGCQFIKENPNIQLSKEDEEALKKIPCIDSIMKIAESDAKFEKFFKSEKGNE